MKRQIVQAGKLAVQQAAVLVERFVRGGVDVSPTALHSARRFFLPQFAPALGTVIHATPVLSALRAAVPNAEIIVASTGLAAEVVRNHPAIDRFIESPSPLKDVRSAAKALRAAGVGGRDTVMLATTGNERTPITMTSMLAGCSVRVGFTVAPAMFDVPMSFDFSRSQIANNLRLLESLGYSPGAWEPVIVPTAGEKAAAEAMLAEAGCCDGRPIAILVTQTSVTQRKGWRAERFAAVAKHLKDRYDAHVVLVGTKAEAEGIDCLRTKIPVDTVSLAGRTSVGTLAAVLQRCDVGVTLDTGPLHVGRAAGLPMVVIAPAWSPVIEWLPVDDPKYRILKNADMKVAPADYIIDEVSETEVIAAVDALIAAYPPSR